MPLHAQPIPGCSWVDSSKTAARRHRLSATTMSEARSSVSEWPDQGAGPEQCVRVARPGGRPGAVCQSGQNREQAPPSPPGREGGLSIGRGPRKEKRTTTYPRAGSRDAATETPKGRRQGARRRSPGPDGRRRPRGRCCAQPLTVGPLRLRGGCQQGGGPIYYQYPVDYDLNRALPRLATSSRSLQRQRRHRPSRRSLEGDWAHTSGREQCRVLSPFVSLSCFM
jgi:hypothetical protein